MGKELPITDLLGRLTAGEDAYTELFNHYLQGARDYASAYVSQSIQSQTSPTAVAMTALGECLDKARKGTKSFAGREEFWTQLLATVRSRAIDAARKATAKKRDARRVTGTVCDSGDGGLEIEAADLATFQELQVKLAQNILSEPDDIDRTICILGILCGFRPQQIRDAIAPLCNQQPPGEPNSTTRRSPAVRTIQLILARRKKKILDDFDVCDLD